MSHRRDIRKIIENKWKTTADLKNAVFVTEKVELGTTVPRVLLLQQSGGFVGDTTGRAYFERIPYVFELFANTYDEADRYAERIENAFDRFHYKVDGKDVIHMTRTAPTLVEQVGNDYYKTVAFYEIAVNLERSRGE